MAVDPGWYESPGEPGRSLYWDGHRWGSESQVSDASGPLASDSDAVHATVEASPSLVNPDLVKARSRTKVLGVAGAVVVMVGLGVALGMGINGSSPQAVTSAPSSQTEVLPSPSAEATQSVTTPGSGSASEPPPAAASSDSPTTVPTPVTKETAAVEDVGFGKVKIGMTVGDLMATGEAVAPETLGMGPCDSYALASGGTADVGFGGDEVIGITFGSGMETSRGVRLGSSEADLNSAYPEAVPDDDFGVPTVSINENVEYLFRVTNGVVDQILLKSKGVSCFT